jgi:hypothetical protein
MQPISFHERLLFSRHDFPPTILCVSRALKNHRPHENARLFC